MKILTALLFVFLLFSAGRAQNQKDLTTAAARAQKSAEIVRLLAAFGTDSVPYEYLQKAKAVAVFPNLTRVNILLNELVIGNGIISMRAGDQWTAPAFLAFKGVDINFKMAGKKSFDTVFLFMDDETLDGLKKGDLAFNSNSKRKAALGPVVGGRGADRTMEGANLIYYTFSDGQLVDTNLSNDTFFRGFGILHDNNMNKSVFGMKTKALFAAPETNIKMPSEIEKFRAALIEISARPSETEGVVTDDSKGRK